MTFSIVARDPRTGAFGIATATAGPMVGALVPHVRPMIGAAATQAMTNPYLAVDALGVADRHNAADALGMALAKDGDADLRQAIIVDHDGLAAGWTGSRCIGHAGHLVERGVAVAGNMLTGGAVLTAMMADFQASLAEMSFADALFAGLKAGAVAGGDKRGIGSAALRIQGEQAYAEIDIRIDLSETPLTDLGNLLGIAKAGPYHAFFQTVPRR